MKTRSVLTLFVICLMSFSAFAAGVGPGDPPKKDPFALDESAVYESVDQLTALEQHLLQNEDATLADLQEANHPLVQGLNFGDDSEFGAAGIQADGPAGLPSFLWGFCLGAIGMLIVYLVTEDNDELKKSLWGCIAQTVLSGVVYGILIATGAYVR